MPTGRGRLDDMITPGEQEATLNWMYSLSREAPFHVRTAVTPAYRRVVIQWRRAEERDARVVGAPITWEETGDYQASDPSCPYVPAGFQAADA